MGSGEVRIGSANNVFNHPDYEEVADTYCAFVNNDGSVHRGEEPEDFVYRIVLSRGHGDNDVIYDRDGKYVDNVSDYRRIIHRLLRAGDSGAWQTVLVKGLGQNIDISTDFVAIENEHRIVITNSGERLAIIGLARNKYPELTDEALVTATGRDVECICDCVADVVWAVNALMGACVARVSKEAAR